MDTLPFKKKTNNNNKNKKQKKLQLSMVNYLDYRFARCCCACPAFQVNGCGKTKLRRPFC